MLSNKSWWNSFFLSLCCKIKSDTFRRWNRDPVFRSTLDKNLKTFIWKCVKSCCSTPSRVSFVPAHLLQITIITSRTKKNSTKSQSGVAVRGLISTIFYLNLDTTDTFQGCWLWKSFWYALLLKAYGLSVAANAICQWHVGRINCLCLSQSNVCFESEWFFEPHWGKNCSSIEIIISIIIIYTKKDHL